MKDTLDRIEMNAKAYRESIEDDDTITLVLSPEVQNNMSRVLGCGSKNELVEIIKTQGDVSFIPVNKH